MLDGVMSFPYQNLHPHSVFLDNIYKTRANCKTKFAQSHMAVQLCSTSMLLSTEESGNLPEAKRIPGTAFTRSRTLESSQSQEHTVGVIGGLSEFSTLLFLEKLARWGSRDEKECVPFILCSDPALNRELSDCNSLVSGRDARFEVNHSLIVENLRHKREFLENSGAKCIVLPCHMCHAWYDEISKECSVPFLNVGDCVARELEKAKLKPLEAGSHARIGVLTWDLALVAGFYEEKLRNQGFEVVLPDTQTMKNIVLPAAEALRRKDIEGARNLLRIAIQILLVRAANTVVLASDEFQDLLPPDDPLLRKCVDPMDYLARSTIRWAQSSEKVHSGTRRT